MAATNLNTMKGSVMSVVITCYDFKEHISNKRFLPYAFTDLPSKLTSSDNIPTVKIQKLTGYRARTSQTIQNK